MPTLKTAEDVEKAISKAEARIEEIDDEISDLEFEKDNLEDDIEEYKQLLKEYSSDEVKAELESEEQAIIEAERQRKLLKKAYGLVPRSIADYWQRI